MDSGVKDESSKELKSFRKVRNRFIILLKNDSRRFVLTVAIVLICILLLTSFLTTWNSTKKIVFLDFVEDSEEYNISAIYSTIQDGFIPNYDVNYLENLSLELQETILEIYPNILSEKIASIMSVEFYTVEVSQTDFYHSELRTTTAEILPILNQSLISGRMPENSNEILYVKEKIDSTYTLNDEISFQTTRIPNDFGQNFTIVGVLEPLENSFGLNGYSTSFLNWQEHIIEYRYVFSCQEVFYTTAPNFFTAINSYEEIDTGRAVIVDFVYNYSELEVQKISQCLSQHQKILQTQAKFSSESQESISLCRDLYSTLQQFTYHWTYESIKSILLLAPVFFLLFYVASEINKGKQTKFEKIVYKMKLQGLSNNAIRSLLLLKALLIALLSVFIGVSIGIIISIIIGKTLSLSATFLTFLEYLLEPLYLTTLGLIVFVLLTGMFMSENQLLRKISVMISKSKQKDNSKKKRVWLTLNERILLLMGIAIALPGGLIAIVFEADPLTQSSFAYSFLGVITLIAWALIIIGTLVTMIGVCNIIARVFIAQFIRIGESRWKNDKNKLNYILKNLVTNKENYQRLVIIALIINVGLLPGITLAPSINNQIQLERDLQVGCADLLIEDWDNYTLPKSEIDAIPGVQKTTTVTLVSINFENIPESDSQFPITTTYHVKILAVHNCEEFNQVIDWSRLGRTRYSENDIKELSRNLTYLMNKEWVKEHGYNDPEVHLYNTFYGEKDIRLILEYVNSFRWFPLLPLVEENTDPYSLEYSFNLVTSLQTIQLLENASSSASATFSEYLLLRATTDGNLTSISEEITDIYSETSIISQASIESELRLTTNKFTSIFTILCSIIVVLVVFLYGYITASAIYQHRLRVIETEFRLGINREEILKGMILEVLLTTIIPILISLLFGVFYMLLLKQLIPIRQIYCPFTLWLPWWIFLLTILTSGTLIIGGNSASLIPQVRSYRPVKVE